MQDRQVQQVRGDGLPARREQCQGQRPALIQQRGTLAPRGRQRFAVAALPLDERGDDPLRAFDQCQFDFADA